MREEKRKMTKNEFALLVDCMVETYGVHSYLNNEDDIEENNLWFECPGCMNIVDYETFAEDEELSCRFCCSICAEPLNSF